MVPTVGRSIFKDALFDSSFNALVNEKITELQTMKKTTKSGAKKVAAKPQKKAATEIPTTNRKGIRFELYRDANGEHRWRMVDGNNRIVANSGEGFTRSQDARRSIENIMAELADPMRPMGLTTAAK